MEFQIWRLNAKVNRTHLEYTCVITEKKGGTGLEQGQALTGTSLLGPRSHTDLGSMESCVIVVPVAISHASEMRVSTPVDECYHQHLPPQAQDGAGREPLASPPPSLGQDKAAVCSETFSVELEACGPGKGGFPERRSLAIKVP